MLSWSFMSCLKLARNKYETISLIFSLLPKVKQNAGMDIALAWRFSISDIAASSVARMIGHKKVCFWVCYTVLISWLIPFVTVYLSKPAVNWSISWKRACHVDSQVMSLFCSLSSSRNKSLCFTLDTTRSVFILLLYMSTVNDCGQVIFRSSLCFNKLIVCWYVPCWLSGL